jgi:hypothetical protein
MLITRQSASNTLLLAATISLMLLAHAGAAAAAEQTLRFKLVTNVQAMGAPTVLPEVGGHKVTVGEYTGVAMLEDGRIAYKQFVDVSDDTAESGEFKGYSTYTFQNGDALTMSYTGGWDAKGAAGNYKVLAGTGAFAGATGTGHFEAADEKWDKAMLWDVSFQLTLPTQ